MGLPKLPLGSHLPMPLRPWRANPVDCLAISNYGNCMSQPGKKHHVHRGHWPAYIQWLRTDSWPAKEQPAHGTLHLRHGRHPPAWLRLVMRVAPLAPLNSALIRGPRQPNPNPIPAHAEAKAEQLSIGFGVHRL